MDVEKIISQFLLPGKLTGIRTLGNGNINDTFLIITTNEEAFERYVLQRINHEIFPHPESMMENFSRITSHLELKWKQGKYGYQVLRLMPSKEGDNFHRDEKGNFWRVCRFVPNGLSLDFPKNKNHAYEAAKAFGAFQANLVDLPGPPLTETISHFHNTRKRFESFLGLVKEDPRNRSRRVVDLIEFAQRRECLTEAISVNSFPLRIVHNDTKLNNVLIHEKTGKGICVLDLDTVMTGCVLHDFGDLARTASCSADEDEVDLKKVSFLPTIFEAVVRGYLESTECLLNAKERETLHLAPQVITFELGLRFLSDYLDGDQYFKTKHPNHNLDRARLQFELLRSMENYSDKIRNIVESALQFCHP